MTFRGLARPTPVVDHLGPALACMGEKLQALQAAMACLELSAAERPPTAAVRPLVGELRRAVDDLSWSYDPDQWSATLAVDPTHPAPQWADTVARARTLLAQLGDLSAPAVPPAAPTPRRTP